MKPVSEEELNSCYILYSKDFVNKKWPFGKPYFTTLENYKSLIDNLPPASKVFPMCDGIETDGVPGISVVRYLTEKNHTVLGTNLEFYLLTLRKTIMK